MKYAGPVSFRFASTAAQAYQGEARKLLGTMLNFMKLGSLAYFKQTHTLQDGTEITLISNAGQHLIEIVPPGTEVEDVEPIPSSRGAMYVWPADEDNVYGWGSPFTSGLGTPLVSEDRSLMPHTKVHRVDDVVTATREVPSVGGNRVWESLNGGTRLSWIHQGTNDHAKVWFNGQDLFSSLYIGKNGDGDWVLSTSAALTNKQSFVAGAALVSNEDGLTLKLGLSSLIMSIPASYTRDDVTEERQLVLSHTGIATDAWAYSVFTEIDFSEDGLGIITENLSLVPIRSFRRFSYVDSSWVEAELYEVTGEFVHNDEATETTSSSYIWPVHLAWAGNDVILTTVEIKVQTRSYSGWTSDSHLGPEFTMNPIYFRTTCPHRADPVEYLEKPQIMQPVIAVQGDESYQKQEAILRITKNGEEIFKDETILYEYAFNVDTTVLEGWKLKTWRAEAEWCANNTTYYPNYWLWDASPYRNLQESIARNIVPVTLDWGGVPSEGSSSLIFQAAFQDQLPLNAPAYTPDPSIVYYKRAQVKEVTYNSLDFHPTSNYLMKFTSVDTGVVEVNQVVPVGSGDHKIDVYDLVNDLQETILPGTQTFSASLISTVYTYHATPVPVSGYNITSLDRKAHALARVNEIWPHEGSGTYADDMISGRYRLDDVGIVCTSTRNEGVGEPTVTNLFSFEFDPSILGLDSLPNGTINQDDITRDLRIVYT